MINKPLIKNSIGSGGSVETKNYCADCGTRQVAKSNKYWCSKCLKQLREEAKQQEQQRILGLIDTLLDSANKYSWVNSDNIDQRKTHALGKQLGWNDALLELRLQITKEG